MKTDEPKIRTKRDKNIGIEHNYTDILNCDGLDCKKNCKTDVHAQSPRNASRDSWKTGRRTIELGYLLERLRFCSSCNMGPVPLTEASVLGEMRKGRAGYLYIKCQNSDCDAVIAANTKLGLGMYAILFY